MLKHGANKTTWCSGSKLGAQNSSSFLLIPAFSRKNGGNSEFTKKLTLNRSAWWLTISPGPLTKCQEIKQTVAETWVFPKIGVPQNGWFMMENPIKIHDLGVPLFFGTTHMCSNTFSTTTQEPWIFSRTSSPKSSKLVFNSYPVPCLFLCFYSSTVCTSVTGD